MIRKKVVLHFQVGRITNPSSAALRLPQYDHTGSETFKSEKHIKERLDTKVVCRRSRVLSGANEWSGGRLTQ